MAYTKTQKALLEAGLHIDEANKLAIDLADEYGDDGDAATLVNEWADDAAKRLYKTRDPLNIVLAYRHPRAVVTFAVWRKIEKEVAG